MKIQIPAWATPYLMNNDPSGLTSGDIAMVDLWARSTVHDMGAFFLNIETEESSFCPDPEFGLPCECYPAKLDGSTFQAFADH